MRHLLVFALMGCIGSVLITESNRRYELVWADEFERVGKPDTNKWDYEHGFVRNEEVQWYQPENAHCEMGILVIEARKEQKLNPGYLNGSKDWRKDRKMINYTSSCMITAGKETWKYGRFEMRGRIDISEGIWPAWWTLGIAKGWPANGEIDIMEYYKGKLLANIACAGKNGKPEWHSNTFPVDSMGGQRWSTEFHVWRMDWTEEHIALYVDNNMLNKVKVDSLVNKDGTGFNPFRQPHYMLLNLAVGGINCGNPEKTIFPRKLEVDYIRVYQEK